MGTPVAFEVLIERRGKSFRAVLVGSTAQSRFSLPELHEVESFHARCSARSRSPRHLTLDDTSGEADTKEAGTRLFRAVFAGEIGKRFDKERRAARAHSSKIRLRLRLTDPVLDVQPWEYLYDPQEEEFLSLAGDVSIVRAIEAGVLPPAQISSPLRMLLVGSCPPGLYPLDLQREQDEIEAALSGYVRHRLLFIERLKPVTLRALSDRLRSGEVHILHFLGHGAFEREEGGILYLEDVFGETMAADRELLDVLLRRESLRLVFLSSCEGARLSPDARFSGVAQTLLRRGVPAVIAMQCRVEDRFAIALAGNFYRALARTRRIAGALTEARRDLLADGFREEWGAPVLYLHAADGEILPELRIGSWGAMVDRLREIDRANWVKLTSVLVLLVVAGFASFGVISALDPCPSPPNLGMKFVEIIPEPFLMGSLDGEANERPPHEVRLDRPYCLGTFEVTQAQWKPITHSNPSLKVGDALPVETVSWNEAHDFLRALNKRDPKGKYRLPNEAEWEYAASDGGRRVYGFGDDEELLPSYGNCAGSRSGETFSIDHFRPATRWGLYAMHGNVAEWVEDEYALYPQGPMKSPAGSITGGRRVRRGGSYVNNADHCRAAARSFGNPDEKRFDVGFRVVRSPLPNPVSSFFSSLLSHLTH
jgi:formylglycine-generating enzyme required for sulfatase activity